MKSPMVALLLSALLCAAYLLRDDLSSAPNENSTLSSVPKTIPAPVAVPVPVPQAPAEVAAAITVTEALSTVAPAVTALPDSPLRALLAAENPTLTPSQLDVVERWFTARENQHLALMEEHQLVSEQAPLGFDCSSSEAVGEASVDASLRHNCVPYFDETAHPYYSYPTDSLLALSHSDAIANQILANRAAEEDVQFTYALRAAALSGKASPFMQLFSRLESINAEEPSELLAKRFVLASLSQSLGVRTLEPESFLAPLAAEFDREARLALQERVEQLEVMMDELRRENGLGPLFTEDEVR